MSVNEFVLSSDDRPGLLVSVRSGTEAEQGLAGGATIIDVKEPQAGPLGAARPSVIREVVQRVAGRVPVTAAAGEIHDWLNEQRSAWHVPPGVSLVKLGLSGCRHLDDWPDLWERTIGRVRGHAQPVAVVYADWQPAGAPQPELICQLAIRARCPAILVDTFDKSAGTLFDHWPANSIERFVLRCRRAGLAVVLAGSLRGESFCRAVRRQPDFVAVRGAACESGRTGHIVSSRVRELQELLNLHKTASPRAAIVTRSGER